MASSSDSDDSRRPQTAGRVPGGAAANLRPSPAVTRGGPVLRGKAQNGEHTAGATTTTTTTPPSSSSSPASLSPQEAASASASHGLETPGAPAPHIHPRARPGDPAAARKAFHIPKKNKEKKELFQSIPVASREFKQDILKILSSSYLETLSSTNFAYVKASMIHNDKLQKEFMEKRKELRTEGRTEKELAELYAFLLVDASEASIICDKGLTVGKSKVTILGNPAMGVYLSKYSDVLQPNPLDTGKQADIIIFKIIKGRVKAVFDNPTKNFTPPTPKHDCHVSKNLNRVTSLFTYRAFDITQFYLYEIGSEGVRQIPRHVCPYAVVSFVYKEDKIPKTPKPTVFGMDDIQSGKSHYTVWKGQLMNKGRFFCLGSLRSASQPFLPMKLPEKLDIETVMSIDCLKSKVPTAVFHKNTFCGLREALKNGLYYSLYEFVERGKTGSNLEALLHTLEEDKQVLIKPLGDRGFLLLFSPLEMAGNDEFQGSKSKFLQALFLFPKPRMMSSFEEMETSAAPHVGPEALPELSMLVPALHFALDRIRKELPNSLQKTTMDVAFENNLIGYSNSSLGKEASAENGKAAKFVLPPYEEKRFAAVRQIRPNVHRILRSYFFNPFHYQFDVSKASEILEQHPNREAEIVSPVSEGVGDKQRLEPQPHLPEEPGSFTVNSTMADYNFMIPYVNIADYDPDKIQELIDLIHTRKRHRPGEPGVVNIEGLAHCISDKNRLGLKRKLASVTERSHKHMKLTQGGPFFGSLGEGESLRLSDLSPEEANGLVCSDTVLRQSDSTTSVPPEAQKLVGFLIEVLKSTKCQTRGAGAHLNQDSRMSLGSSGDELSRNDADYCWDQNDLRTHKKMRENIDDPTSPTEASAQKLSEAGFPSCLDPESPRLLESDPCLMYPEDSLFRSQTNEQLSGENVSQHNMRSEYPEEQSLESAGSVEVSPCTNASLEQLYSRKPSTPESNSDNEINWKLVPITHMKSRIEQLFYLPPEDSCPVDPRVIIRQNDINHYQSASSSHAGACSGSNEYVPDLQHRDPDPTVYETNGHLSASKDSSSASVVENMVLLEYNTFAKKMRQLLKKERVDYSTEKRQPTFSTPSKVPSLSRFASVCTRDVAIQNYVSQLRKKMNCIVADACSRRSTISGRLPLPSPKELPQTVLKRTAASSTIVQDLGASTISRLRTLRYAAQEAVNNTGSACAGQTCGEKTQENQKDPKSDSLKPVPSQLTSGLSINVGSQEANGVTELPKAQPCISNLIQQLKPEVFCSLVKIIKDVQKNTVKFYVYEMEETSSVCAEIKDYLTGLGNKECHPDRFLKDGFMDKLLIIIQNEDIAAHIHKIPLLMSLKKMSSVSFAGVDSLDDVQNHTYNELFVSGGFVVSDETVLNPKSVTIEKLQTLLKFLEDLSNPGSKWLWKIHFKIYKRLKEQARTNTAASNILSVLDKYKKCNVVEVLSYHDCDSKARSTIELDCLVKLQAQNIQHRHVVFLTEKNLETLPSYTECGVVVTCVEDFVNNFRSLIGYHSSTVEDKQSGVESQDSLQAEAASADAENLVTRNEGNCDEEDMSLDSADDLPCIEICSEMSEDVYAADSCLHIELRGTEGDPGQPEAETPSADANAAPTTAELDFVNNVQLSVAGSASSQLGGGQKGPKAQGFTSYKSGLFHPRLPMESDYRNFNVMTHQSFLSSGMRPPYVASLHYNNQEPGGYYFPAYSSHNMVYNERDRLTSHWDHSWRVASETPLTYQQQKQQY